MFPRTFDGVVLTGFATETLGQKYFMAASDYLPANTADAARFGAYSNEYLLSASSQGDRLLFFYNGGYAEDVFQKGEAEKQTVTIGELGQYVALPGR